MVQTRRIDPNLVVADRFEHKHDFLARGKHAIEVVLEFHVRNVDDSRGGRNKAAINPLKS